MRGSWRIGLGCRRICFCRGYRKPKSGVDSTVGGDPMLSSGRNIIVIGTSLGGLHILDEIVGHLSADLSASIFVVQHMGPQSTGAALLQTLNRHKRFECKLASDKEIFERGKIYIAPPDNHLLVKKTRMLVT